MFHEFMYEFGCTKAPDVATAYEALAPAARDSDSARASRVDLTVGQGGLGLRGS